MAQIQKGTTYSTGDQVTATNLNALADAAILLPGAITDQTAKTVPLAADTVLIHSAADTALRKSTLTQLFSNATGIPLTTGVTGILPAANGGTGVNNGANTITIAGNVTHAGAFTQSFTATANTSLTLPVTGTLATLAGSEALSNKTITASAFNGTVGATTASTGAFTTLSATSGISALGNLIALRTANNLSTSTTKESRWVGVHYNTAEEDMMVMYPFSTATENTIAYGGGASAQNAATKHDFYVAANNTTTSGTLGASISSTGLAVTGALSATGDITASAGAFKLTDTYTLNWGNGNSAVQGSVAGGYVRLYAGGSIIATATSTGLTVTGGLSVTSTISTSAGQLITTTAGAALGSMTGGANAYFDWSDGTTTSRLQMVGGELNFGTAAGGGTINLRVNSATIASVTSTGLGIGTTSPSYRLDVRALSTATAASFSSTNTTAYSGTSYNGGSARMFLSTSNATGAFNGIQFTTGGSNEGFFGVVQESGGAGAFVFQGYTGAAYTERARIDSSGQFLVGKTSDSVANNGFHSNPNGYASFSMAGSTSATDTLNVYSTGAAAYRFYVDMAGTIRATNTTISGISDQRLKENIVDLDDGLNAVMALKPRKFDWKAGKGKDIKNDRGFIAQEFETVFPDLIDTWKDEAPEGEEPYKSVRADLIPVIVKALQELNANLVAELQSLRQRVAALESN